MKHVRCAIYTRKSSDEGLEQSFNSLDAQREACGAYILSQASEGWTALPEVYDDGGLSGGTLERPAVNRFNAFAMASWAQGGFPHVDRHGSIVNYRTCGSSVPTTCGFVGD